MKKIIYWCRNDLRIHDNIVLSSKLNYNQLLLPVYIIDNRFSEKHNLGFYRYSKTRKIFLVESLIDFKQNLKKLNSNLLIRFGDPAEIIPKLAIELKADIVYATKEHTYEEIRLENSIEKNLGDIPIKFFEQISLISPLHLPFEISELPDTFSEFRKRVEKDAKIRSPFNVPSLLPPFPKINLKDDISDLENIVASSNLVDPRSAFKFRGGEKEGLNRLDDYIWKRRLISHYKYTRNGMIGEAYSSKFSPWLALGALSPRQLYNEVKRFERIEVKNISTYWMVFELLWRDYFRFVAIKYGDKIFLKKGIKNVTRKYSNDKMIFSKWMNGETGNDFVDANMNELNTTGFMSNRGRQNVASYLVNDLGIDWRWGASYFESRLIDYDVCSNWGNWMYIAGVGNDPRPNRKFNTQIQAKKYDSNGRFRELWLEEQLINYS